MRSFLTSRSFLASVSLLVLLAVSGCVHKIDLPQGTPITATKAANVKVGMTPEQVLYVLGSPAIKDPLAPRRWDYLYDYTAGTDGKRAGKSDVKNASQYVSVYFGTDGRVIRVDGVGQ